MNIWDFNFNYNGQAILWNLFLFLFAIFKYRGVYLGNITVKSSYIPVFLLAALFSTYAYNEADFYHYQFHYDMMKHNNVQSLSEPIYLWIAQNLPDNYFVWRLAIWGCAALLMVIALKKVGVNACCAGLMFPLYLWNQFSITRGALGFAIIVLSVILFFETNITKKAIAIVIIMLSIAFHDSIAVFLLLLPLAFIMPLNSKLLKVSLLLFPVLYGSIMMMTTYLFKLDFLADTTENLAGRYMERSKAALNFFGVAFDILHFAGQLMILYLSTTFVLKYKQHINRAVIFLLKYGYVLVYISFLFYGQGTSSFISSRFLHASTFPLAIVYSYYLTKHHVTRTDRMVFLLLGSYTSYEMLYAMYKWW